MTTIPAYEFIAAGPRAKFPHTGPVYYGTGKLPYTAALKGVELKDKSGRLNRAFKTAEAAALAIVKHVEQEEADPTDDHAEFSDLNQMG